MTDDEKWFEDAYARDRAEKEKYLKEHPEFVPDGDFWDSHSCSAFADAFGVCQWCGNLIYGSYAYRDAYGWE